MELDAPRLDFPGIIAQAPGFISFSLQDIRAPLALLPELGTLGRSCCAVHPQCPGVCWTHSLSWGSLLKAIEASKILSPHELHGLLALRICRRLLSPASMKSHARTAVFPAVFFFSLTSFFSFPFPTLFQTVGLRVIQDCKLPRALQSAHERGVGWQECPSHESGGCNQLKAGRAHQLKAGRAHDVCDPYLAFPSFSTCTDLTPCSTMPKWDCSLAGCKTMCTEVFQRENKKGGELWRNRS